MIKAKAKVQDCRYVRTRLTAKGSGEDVLHETVGIIRSVRNIYNSTYGTQGGDGYIAELVRILQDPESELYK